MAKGSSGGKRGGSAGGGGVSDGLSGLPESSELRRQRDSFVINRSEEDDQRALKALELTEKQGLIDKRIDKLDVEIDKASEANKKTLKAEQEKLISLSKRMSELKLSIEGYSKRQAGVYKNLNPLAGEKTIKTGSYRMINKEAGIYQKNDLVNAPVKGRILGAVGVNKSGITHLPSGLKFTSKNKISKEQMQDLTNLSKKYGHDGSNKYFLQDALSYLKKNNLA
jgi:hypothetical protein